MALETGQNWWYDEPTPANLAGPGMLRYRCCTSRAGERRLPSAMGHARDPTRAAPVERGSASSDSR